VRPPTDRAIRRLLLSDAVAAVHAQSRGVYGYRRVQAALRIESDLVVNHKLVASIMAQLGIHGLPRRKPRRRNLVSIATSSDLVNRDFTATAANQLWVTDITEHPTTEARVYACVVLDAYSRKAVGWAISRRADTTLVNSAIDMAARSRTITPKTIIHTDHGPQFTAWAFTTNLRAYGLRLSMGTIGDCYDCQSVCAGSSVDSEVLTSAA